MKKLFRYLLYIMPLVLFFSYYPLIKLGENETMYFELSLPLVWLVVFDVVAFVLLFKTKRREVFHKILGGLSWWLFSLFVLISSFWSLNPVRGVLTSGLLWLLMLAVAEIHELREYLTPEFWKVFLRWFFGAALFVCVWCVVQCILDINGVQQEVTLLCDGCTYKMFGFPHPNGFAIEPQFMGNLLLAPIFCAAAIFCKSSSRVATARRHGGGALTLALPRSAHSQILQKTSGWLLFAFATTLFLTFSRGAIYACVVGMVFLGCFSWFRAKKAERKQVGKNILKMIGVFVISFIFALNLQGAMAAMSPTSDTYKDGVAKVLNQLSLGIIDVRETGVAEENSALSSDEEPVENLEVVENSEDKTESAFDGYVAESTDTRVRLFNSALTVWRKDFKTALVGVGIGGAGQALFDNGFSPAPREIVQNEYASILLETGLVGVSLFVLLIVLIVKVALKAKTAGLILSLIVAYAVSLCFFSGLPNALQIILLPGVLIYLQLHPRPARL